MSQRRYIPSSRASEAEAATVCSAGPRIRGHDAAWLEEAFFPCSWPLLLCQAKSQSTAIITSQPPSMPQALVMTVVVEGTAEAGS